MEERESESTDNPDSCQVFVKLIYYLNDDKEKEGILPLLNFNEKSDVITYNEITYSFYLFLKTLEQSKSYSNDSYIESSRINSEFSDLKQIYIDFEFIRYSDGEGWIRLEENDVIQLGDRSNDILNIDDLEIMIKASIVKDEKLKIKNMYQDIDNEIENIYERLSQNKENNSTPDAPLNLIVLTANPLMDNEKELRTMNDFHIITSKIYKLFEEEDFLKYTEFFPLTMKKLIEIISDENKIPVILHLICKSTYNNKVLNLIFEQEMNNYNLEFINKEKLDAVFKNTEKNNEKNNEKNSEKNVEKKSGKNSEKNNEKNSENNIENNIKKITLIISTPLAEDVYDLFKDYGFKNLIVQHTTLADVDFIADFNYEFYRDLIIYSDKTINKRFEYVFNNAFNIYIDNNNPPTFCCCLHKHQKTCEFVTNLNNELYNDNNNKKDNNKNNKNNKFTINIDNLKETLPHFYHLFPDCPVIPTCQERLIRNGKLSLLIQNSFCLHHNNCNKSFNHLKYNMSKLSKTFYHYCCCEVAPENHNKIYIFRQDFSNEKKNNIINFRRAEILKERKFIPYYDKMELLIGKNKIVSDVIKFFHSQDKYLNIYSDKMENLKKIGNIIIEYYKEKNYDLYNPNKEDNEEENNPQKNKDLFIKRINSETSSINSDKIKIKENNNLNLVKSFPEIPLTFKRKKFDFEEIDLNDNENTILKEDLKYDNLNINKFFFVYVNDNKLVKKISNKNNKMIFFYEIKENNNPKFLFFKEPKLKSEIDYIYKKEEINPNEYIKFQNYKILRNNWRLKEEKK